MIKKAKRVHFIGIGGIGVSTLAQIFNDQGKKVTGSDIEDSDHIQHMKKDGIKIKIGHSAKNIPTNCNLVIHSFAIESDNPELLKAKKLRIKILTYPEALGEFSRDYHTVAITGTHGKSTTTSMTALLALKSGLDPTVVVGTKMKELGNKNYRIGKSNLLIVEACEFRNAFLNYKMDVLAIINIDSDHLDFFKTQDAYVKAFNKACKSVGKKGLIILDADDKFSQGIEEGAKAKVIKITSNQTLKNAPSHAYLNERLLKIGKKSLKLRPNVPGKFNIRNSAFAAVIGEHLKISNRKIETGIAAFRGCWRRMELKKIKLKNVKFYDDYGHLPAEIDVTLNAMRETHPKEKILAVFQPHQFIRIKNYLTEFGMCFSSADDVLIPDILRNRDTLEEMASIQTHELIDEIKKHKKNVFHSTDVPDTAKWIKKNGKKYGVIVAMGSGDVKKLYKLI
ncbi:MAG: UDP-N-acetylmuramate--L-alanine ligase [Candidatus Gracilibacteria bacterium]